MPAAISEQCSGARVAASLSLLLLGGGALIVAPLVDASPSSGVQHSVPSPVASEAKPGGTTTLAPGRTPGIAAPFANLSLDDRFTLAVGRAFFRDPWIAAPATTTARDGLGPLYNAHACMSCHPDGGRGALAADGSASSALLLRLGRSDGDGAILPDPVYGDQLQTLATGAGGAAEAADRPVREGQAEVEYTPVRGSFADGTPFELRKPRWRADALAYGELDPEVRVSARLAPSLRGVGLLEAIPEAAIVAAADPEDRDGDGISGRPSLVRAPGSDQRMLGRFGWKGVQPTVRRQVASALHNDIGITSEVYPTQPCSDAQQACRRAPDGGDAPTGHEISAKLLDELTRFTATLALPARTKSKDEQTIAGRELFYRSGCAACHTPSFVTGDVAPAEASRQTIWPYSDLLLHDLGTELADQVGEGSALASEWRTAPLWGLGRATRDRERTSLLHDGRARSIEEAILWHGGEACGAREEFVKLPRERREALVAFLATL